MKALRRLRRRSKTVLALRSILGKKRRGHGPRLVDPKTGEAEDLVLRRYAPVQKPGRSRQDYGTPWVLVRALNKRFGPIAWDLAATAKNAKAKNFITQKQDTFKVDWSKLPRGKDEWLFLNPPFGQIEKFVRRCVKMMKRGAKILFLVPASVGAQWYRRWIWKYARVYYLGQRISFQGSSGPYPKDCIIAVFDGQGAVEDGEHYIWNWKTDELF